jgi:integrase
VASSKTEAGEGRSLLLWSRVRAALSVWLSRFPDAVEDSYVFPQIKVVLKSQTEAAISDYDLNKASGPPKKAWTTAQRKAGVDLRLHDLRHHFITKLLENPLVAEETVRRLVGHVDPRMLQRYSHIRVTVADKAMEAMDTPPRCSDPLQNPLQITHPSSPLLQ